MRALCVLQVSTRLGLFYIWHRLLSGISQLKKKNRETKNQKSEVRGHIVDRVRKKNTVKYVTLRLITKSSREHLRNADVVNQGNSQNYTKVQKYV